MRKHLSLFAAAVAFVTVAWAPALRAEVSAETDAAGHYLRVTITANASVKRLRIWSVQRTRPLYYPVNPGGDLNGDLWPSIAENPFDSNRPWVIWSRFTGAGYDLAWSRWLPGGWSPTDWVEAPEPAAAGDDLDSNATFDSQGRAYLVWWRNESGIGRVYLSLFLVTRWMPAFAVSEAGVDSRLPTVTMLDDSQVRVEYDTPEGSVVRIVAFNRPTTITDDIDPFGRLDISPPRRKPKTSLGD